MRNNELDEMQLLTRNKIGNQAFMLLVYLLMIDIGLYGFGFRWLQYPTNVWIILLACMMYYTIRIIWLRSFVGPQQSNQRIARKTRYLIGVTGLVGAVTAFIWQKYFMKAPATNGDDNSAMILLVFSIVMLIILAVVSSIAKWQSNNDDNK